MVATTAKVLHAPPTSRPKGNTMQPRVQDLLKEMGPGTGVPTSYDTAWIARLEEIDKEMSNRALAWLCEHQLPDGSWGAAEPFYYHDRVISTLAAMIALTHRGKRSRDRRRIEKGLKALERITSKETASMAINPDRATAGYEMIVPTLVAEAERIGIIKQQGNEILERLASQRSAKLAVLKKRKVTREMALAFSSEMAGQDVQEMLDIDNLLENDGSVSHSPSATAYFLLQIRPESDKSLSYLRHSVDRRGGTPYAVPFEICERAWVLWNVGLLDAIDDDLMAAAQPHLEYLRSVWNDKGVGFAAGHSVVDGDDTSVVFEVLTRFGYHLDLESLLSFKEDGHFRCYSLEISKSISTNIHFLGALKRYGLQPNDPILQGILAYLRESMTANAYWFDKWNASPFYSTSHAIIALIGVDNSLVQHSLNWILQNQRADGSWGYFKNSSAEETAYAIQALCIWKRAGGQVSYDVLSHAVEWLTRHTEPPYPYFWIAKTLNHSEWIVRAEILSSLRLAEEVLQR